jgi:hypothetical protein
MGTVMGVWISKKQGVFGSPYQRIFKKEIARLFISLKRKPDISVKKQRLIS